MPVLVTLIDRSAYALNASSRMLRTALSALRLSAATFAFSVEIYFTSNISEWQPSSPHKKGYVAVPKVSKKGSSNMPSNAYIPT